MGGLLLKKTFRDLRSSLAQSIALVVIVALGVASLLALIGAYRDLGSSYDRTYAELHLADVTFAVQSAPQAMIEKIAAIPGVAGVTGRLIVETGIDVADTSGHNEQVRCRMIGIPGDKQPKVDSLFVSSGKYFGEVPGSSSRKAAGSALVEAHFAKIYHVAAGGTVYPLINGRKTPLRVSGIVASPEYLIVSASRQDIIPSARTFGVLFVPRRTLQTMVHAGPTVNNFAVLFTPGADSKTVIARIRGELEPYGLSTVTLKKDQPSNSALHLDLEGYREIGYLMPALILLAAAASLFVMLSRQIRSQQTQIGLMKALGYPRRRVLAHYLTTSLVISLLGALVGIAAGYPLGTAITTAYAQELGIPLVQGRFYPDVALAGAAVTIVVALLAGLLPALRASRLVPATAMRPDPARALTRGGRTFVDRLLPLGLGLRLPLRNVFRVRSRSVSTIVGVVFAFVLVLSSWALILSMQQLLYQTFHQVERWNMAATFDQPKNSSLVDQVRRWKGVHEVQPLIQLPVTLRKEGSGSGTQAATGASGTPAGGQELLLTAMSPTNSLHALQLEGNITPSQALAKGGIVVSRPTADKLHLRIGSAVELDTPLGRRHAKVAAISDELMSAVAYVSLAEAEAWIPFHIRVINGLYLTVDPSQATAIKARLYHLPGAASVRLKSAVESDWESLMGLYYVFMGIILLFALAMAFALLFNTMTVNVLEQQREFATMRSIGAGGSRIALLMTVENVLLWLIALVPGLVLGTLAAEQMVSAFQSEAFYMTATVTTGSYLITAGGILLTMLLAALPAIRRINRLDLAQATKVLT